MNIHRCSTNRLLQNWDAVRWEVLNEVSDFRVSLAVALHRVTGREIRESGGLEIMTTPAGDYIVIRNGKLLDNPMLAGNI